MLGIAFVVGGLLGFLPVLGFWMIAVGLLILSVDLPPVRRLRRRIEVGWGRSRLIRTVSDLLHSWRSTAGKKKGPSG